MTSTATLYDHDTGDRIGPATDEQLEASQEAEGGVIIIDEADGEIVRADDEGTLVSHCSVVTRRVYALED